MGKIETMKEHVDNVSKEKEMLRNNLKENYRNHKHYRNEKCLWYTSQTQLRKESVRFKIHQQELHKMKRELKNGKKI